MKLAADFVIVIMTIIGASSTIAAEKLLQTTPPFTLLFLRFTLAALLLFLCFPQKIASSAAASLRGGSAIGAGFGLGCLFLYLGLPHVHSGHAMFLISLEFVIVPLAAFLFYRTKPSRREWIAFIIALAGVWIFTNPLQGDFSRYDLLIIISACCYTIYTISLSRYTDKNLYLGQIFISYCFIGAISSICMLLLSPPMQTAWSSSEYWVFGYFIFFSTLARFLGQSWAQRIASPTRTALIFLMEPLFALLLSNLFFGEVFSAPKIIGGFFILSASLVAVFPFKKGELLAA